MLVFKLWKTKASGIVEWYAQYKSMSLGDIGNIGPFASREETIAYLKAEGIRLAPHLDTK